VEKHTFQIVENLQGKGLQIFLLSSCPVMLGEFKKRGWTNQRWWLGFPPVNLSTKWLFFFIWPLLLISSVIGLIYCKYKFKVDKLYCLNLTEKLVMTPVAKLFGYKVIWLEHLSIEPVISKNIFRFLYKWWSRFAKIVAISEFVKIELEKIGIKNIKVIYHGIDPAKYKKQENLFEVMAEKRSEDYDKKNFTIGCVAKLEKVKGLEYLIKAVDLLKPEIPNIDCIIVGEGSQKQNLHWLIETLNLQNKVKLVGYKDNFLDWVYDFDIFVLPSLKESLGIILLETMACKIPIVSTDVGGVSEIINNENQGALVESKSPRAIADAVLRLYNLGEDAINPWPQVANPIEDKFLLEIMLEEYKRILIST